MESTFLLDDFSHFYSFFQDSGNSIPDDSAGVGGSGGGGRKRRRGSAGGSGDESGALKEILASLLLLDEEEKLDQDKWVLDCQNERALFEENHRQRAQAMNEYRADMVERFGEMEESESSRVKRARRSASAVAAGVAAAASSSDNVGSESSSQPVGHHRRLWVKDRSKAWWEWCSHPDFPEEEFRRAFRMSRATFDMICDELDSAVTKKDTMLRLAIPVRQRVAVCIWRLATGEPLRLVSKRFGLGISTCHKLVLEVCAAIKTVLMPKFLQWPDDEKLKMVKDEFESISGIPNVGGSMYTTHIPIIAPKVNVAAYFNKRHTERNQKTSYSVTVQGVVDPKGVFTDVSIGWPGSMSDEKVLEQSSLYQRANSGFLRDVWVVGGSGYPLLDWVMVPYTHQNLTWTQHAFNEKTGDIQKVAKEAFARLKRRWSCLQKRTEVKLLDLPVVLGACCVLHNICQMRNEEMDPELQFELFDDEMIPENGLRSASSAQARDRIAHDLLHHGLAGNAFL
ncbi:hypothetical protein PVL29_014029 [Vitis rotundifolia]|uniref:DDE Tnp4 domain-containing protein n=1 Tax=Vitis rotundifolia TaxID=103349 RepID=A0AA39DLM5_VITRO|nr:hypothetical protein PVL29_014029 [Vitis rotundifolia]